MPVITSQLEQLLRNANGYQCPRHDGRTNKHERDMTTKRFYNDDNARAMFITSRCGDLRLNLTPASSAIRLTSTWNHHLAEQCDCGENRTAQTQQMCVHSLYTRNSIERRVMSKQKPKKLKSSKILDPDEKIQKRMADIGS